eukprot:TRINITY_DN6310_c0_g1_i1.p1 TRINITY_DN6310_c0_g1~~TRINITY_DN6310_c0_g1_i1.p1  ORF type:complete len:711 (+),score=128.11 TRINITY_DN6310_c0_g1_i1:147-2279(+)
MSFFEKLGFRKKKKTPDSPRNEEGREGGTNLKHVSQTSMLEEGMLENVSDVGEMDVESEQSDASVPTQEDDRMPLPVSDSGVEDENFAPSYDSDGFGDDSDDFSFGASGEFPADGLRSTTDGLRMSGLDNFGTGPIDATELSNLTAWVRYHVHNLNMENILAGTCLDIVNHTQRVRIALQTNFLDSWTAMAWGVDPEIPIIVDLMFGWKYLNARECPQVEIYQSSQTDLDVFEIKDKQGFGLRWFLEYRVASALSKNWKKLYPDAATSDAINSKTKDLPQEVATFCQPMADVNQLVEFGIPHGVAYRALSRSRNAPAALDLISNASEQDEFLYPKMEPLSAPKAGSFEELESFVSCENPLRQLAAYTAARFRTCTTYCVICDQLLEYEGVKPGICNNELCSHSYETYGLGLDVFGEVKNNYEVLQLLISASIAASKYKHPKGADTFEPYPRSITAAVTDDNGKEIERRSFMQADGIHKNINEVTRVGDLIPPISELRTVQDESALSSLLDNIDVLCYPLIRWILSSNLAHISPLPEKHHIAAMNTPHQFVLVSANPQKEAIFRSRREKAKAKKGGSGSFFAFHGSAIGNWHCIFRKGLKNYSKTKFMSTGAVHGNGIYLANSARTSFGYMRTGPSWVNCSIGTDLCCIALCEVVDEREDSSVIKTASKDIFVVADEDIVNTRFFFVYPHTANRSGAPSASTMEIDRSLFD